MKQIRWVVLMLVVGLVGLISSSLVYPSSSQPRIVFLREEPSTAEENEEEECGGEYGSLPPANAWLAAIDGKNPIQITSSRTASSPKWLNAQTVAVVSNSDIWLVEVGEKGRKSATRLTKFEDVEVLTCSPGGEWIFFIRASWDEPTPFLCKIRKDGKNYQVLKKDVRISPRPVLATSQDRIFYGFQEGRDFNTAGIKSVDYEGKNEKILYRIPEHPEHGLSEEIWALTCSKDGQRVIFSALDFAKSVETVETNVIVWKQIDTQTFKTKTLFNSENIAFGCSFMPEETGILYDDGLNLYLRDIIGTDAKPQLLIENAIAPDV